MDIALCLLSIALAQSAKVPDAEGLKFFEEKIKPVLARSCFKCHSADGKVRGGLRLDTRELMLEGGASGPIVILGKPKESLLIRALKYQDPDYQMPPSGPLSGTIIKDFEKWVEMGAPYPSAEGEMMGAAMEPMMGSSGSVVDVADAPNIRDDGFVDWEKARQHWSLIPMKSHPTPAVQDEGWSWCDIDRFVFEGMVENGVAPVADAEKSVWLRRVTFDLIGLPPTPEEVIAFTRDRSPTAFDRVVDRLLASSAFGERWGRHWLDVARFAESSGKEVNIAYPYAWRYRNYVIDAFNNDKPYNQFLREQLAGDLIPSKDLNERTEHLIATGFLAVGAKGHNTRGRSQFTADTIDEQIDAVGQSMLGLTIACARCHDHKFDPIPQRDYYALAGIFLSSKICYGTEQSAGNNFPSEYINLPVGTAANGAKLSPDQIQMADVTITRFAEQLAALEVRAEKGEVDRGNLRNQRQFLGSLESARARFDDAGNPTDANLVAMGVLEGSGRNAPILKRGEVNQAGETVVRGFPQVLEGDWVPTIRTGSGRKELAQWITDPMNPLTARVAVNRVWGHLFGKGLVSTPDNFGVTGMTPTHPELLDSLALSFIERGWSVKSLIREITLSHTYRLSSKTESRSMKMDPDALWLWRMPQRRLEGEAIRDAMLMASGELSRSRPDGSQAQSLEGPIRNGGVMTRLIDSTVPYRSVYMPILRDVVPEMLEVFDFCDPSLPCGDRAETTVASQALFLMNDAQVIASAEAFADRLMAMDLKDLERIEYAFQLAFGRDPTSSERGASRKFFDDFSKAESASQSNSPIRERAWTAFCQSLYLTAEFRTLD